MTNPYHLSCGTDDVLDMIWPPPPPGSFPTLRKIPGDRAVEAFRKALDTGNLRETLSGDDMAALLIEIIDRENARYDAECSVTPSATSAPL